MSKYIKYGLFQGHNLYRIPKPNGKKELVKPNILTIFDQNDLENDVYKLILQFTLFEETSLWLKNNADKKEVLQNLVIKEYNYKTNKIRKIKISTVKQILNNLYFNLPKACEFLSLIYNSIFEVKNINSFNIVIFTGKITDFTNFLKKSGIKEKIVINYEFEQDTNKTKAIITDIDEETHFLLSLNYNDFTLIKVNNTSQ